MLKPILLMVRIVGSRKLPPRQSPSANVMSFNPGAYSTRVRMRVRMDVVSTVSPFSAPRSGIKENRVSTPIEIGMSPTKWRKRGPDHNRRSEVNCTADEEPGAWRRKYHYRIVYRNIEIRRIYGHDLDVAARIDHRVVRCRLQIAVPPGLIPHSLHSIHHVATLAQHRVSKLLRPAGILRHHVKN